MACCHPFHCSRHSTAHLSPQPLGHASHAAAHAAAAVHAAAAAAAHTRLSPQHPHQLAAAAAAAGQPLYHQSDLYRRPTVYVTTTQPAYLPAGHQVPPFTAGYEYEQTVI